MNDDEFQKHNPHTPQTILLHTVATHLRGVWQPLARRRQRNTTVPRLPETSYLPPPKQHLDWHRLLPRRPCTDTHSSIQVPQVRVPRALYGATHERGSASNTQRPISDAHPGATLEEQTARPRIQPSRIADERITENHWHSVVCEHSHPHTKYAHANGIITQAT